MYWMQSFDRIYNEIVKRSNNNYITLTESSIKIELKGTSIIINLNK